MSDISRFSFHFQLNAVGFGPTCLRMVARHYGKHYDANSIRRKAGFSEEGVSLLSISETAEKIGFRPRGYFAFQHIVSRK